MPQPARRRPLRHPRVPAGGRLAGVHRLRVLRRRPAGLPDHLCRRLLARAGQSRRDGRCPVRDAAAARDARPPQRGGAALTRSVGDGGPVRDRAAHHRRARGPADVRPRGAPRPGRPAARRRQRPRTTTLARGPRPVPRGPRRHSARGRPPGHVLPRGDDDQGRSARRGPDRRGPARRRRPRRRPARGRPLLSPVPDPAAGQRRDRRRDHGRAVDALPSRVTGPRTRRSAVRRRGWSGPARAPVRRRTPAR